jgi:hypothetical protein
MAGAEIHGPYDRGLSYRTLGLSRLRRLHVKRRQRRRFIVRNLALYLELGRIG